MVHAPVSISYTTIVETLKRIIRTAVIVLVHTGYHTNYSLCIYEYHTDRELLLHSVLLVPVRNDCCRSAGEGELLDGLLQLPVVQVLRGPLVHAVILQLEAKLHHGCYGLLPTRFFLLLRARPLCAGSPAAVCVEGSETKWVGVALP